MTRLLAMAVLLGSVWAGCSGSGGGGNPDGDGNPDPDGGQGSDAFFLQSLSDEGPGPKPLALAVGPNDRVGVAYVHTLADAGYEIRYVEWASGQAAPPQTVAEVPLAYGVDVAFRADGEPAVAYMGGGNEDNTLFWKVSDAVVSYRSGGATWTEHVVVVGGDEAVAGNPVSDRGNVVGLSPALAFDGSKAYFAYRDVHNGQFEKQDYEASDLELAEGSPGAWQKRVVMVGGDDKQAYGGNIDLVMAGNQPAVATDRMPDRWEGPGKDVLFSRRNADGSWTPKKSVLTVSNTQVGPSLAHHAGFGYGIAVLDRGTNTLLFTQSQDGDTWTLPDPVVQSGTRGWYPSLAIDPEFEEPSIAYVVCARRAGVNEGSCPEDEESLHLITRVGGNWRDRTVDEAGAYLPKLSHLSTGKRVIAYRTRDGALKLAVEK